MTSMTDVLAARTTTDLFRRTAEYVRAKQFAAEETRYRTALGCFAQYASRALASGDPALIAVAGSSTLLSFAALSEPVLDTLEKWQQTAA